MIETISVKCFLFQSSKRNTILTGYFEEKTGESCYFVNVYSKTNNKRRLNIKQKYLDVVPPPHTHTDTRQCF